MSDTENPLVGKTLVLTYETGFPGASVEINFISNTQKISTGRGPSGGFVSTDDYEMAVVAPGIYMASWTGDDGHVVTAVWNLNTMRAYGTYSNGQPTRISMSGTIDALRQSDRGN